MLLETIILIAAIPTAILISYLSRDELIAGKKWFLCLILASTIGVFIGFVKKSQSIALTSFFIIIFSFISYLMSFNKKLTKK